MGSANRQKTKNSPPVRLLALNRERRIEPPEPPEPLEPEPRPELDPPEPLEPPEPEPCPEPLELFESEPDEGFDLLARRGGKSLDIVWSGIAACFSLSLACLWFRLDFVVQIG